MIPSSRNFQISILEDKNALKKGVLSGWGSSVNNYNNGLVNWALVGGMGSFINELESVGLG